MTTSLGISRREMGWTKPGTDLLTTAEEIGCDNSAVSHVAAWDPRYCHSVSSTVAVQYSQ